MNKLLETKSRFLSDALNKGEYIDEMYKIHSMLFEYSDFISTTNISGIEILDNRIIMTFRDSGIRFICSKNDKRLAALDTLNFGSYEQDDMLIQLALIEDGFNVLDIGANFGWYGMHIAKLKPATHVYSFEPIPSTFDFLNENIRLNDLINISTLNFGFSDAEGTFKFYYDPNLSVNASLANVSGNAGIENITCSVKKLDVFVNSKNLKVDFIKCDVEGAELMVFKGGVDTIKKNCPIIFTEMLRKWSAKFNYHPNDIILFFKNLGYKCFTSLNGKLKAFENVDENTTETNYFFLHEKKHSLQIESFLIK